MPRSPCCAPIRATRCIPMPGGMSARSSPAACLPPAITNWPMRSPPSTGSYPKSYAEADFLLGYIALRFKKNPALAFDDFAHILARADTPYAKARAAYWGGRAAEAENKPDLAKKWYAAGAENMATFYGQLA